MASAAISRSAIIVRRHEHIAEQFGAVEFPDAAQGVEQVIAKLRGGYSLRQTAERLKASPPQWDVSPSMAKIIIAGPEAKRLTKMKTLATQRAANLPAAKANAAAKPAPQAQARS